MSTSSSATILVVEDDPSISELIAWVLDDAGFVVRTARSVAEALNAYDQSQPELVIADLFLPDGFGSEMLRLIQDRGRNPAAATLVMSAHPRAREQARAAGADACLTKPFDLDEFFQIVETLLARDRSLSASAQGDPPVVAGG